MYKSVKQQVLEFLQNSPGAHHSGAIQRMDFRTKKNGLASGDSLKRRLNELAEEGLIHSRIENNQAYFSISESHKKRVHTFVPVIVDGVRMMREVII
jgi:DNA-binding HxlR family transcriptional regulator